MRRKDRQVIDENEIDNIIRSCYCCRLGFVDDGKAYIVPMNFGFENIGEQRVFYFHGATVGRKNEIIMKNPNVCFELDTNHKLVTDELAEEYTSKYQSVIGEGEIEVVEDFDDKYKALNEIMKQYSSKSDWEISERMINATFIFKLNVTSISCKQNI